eukprot:356492-Chlamydomonas_euryale.AAC.1
MQGGGSRLLKHRNNFSFTSLPSLIHRLCPQVRPGGHIHTFTHLLDTPPFARQVHPAGTFTLSHLLDIFPMPDPMLVISVCGETLLAALENGVSEYPKREGRFPQVWERGGVDVWNPGNAVVWGGVGPQRSLPLLFSECVGG